ncbi:hypothetical protein Smp_169930 [Schistosoma mansoni]|uniref:hypothetical protein n=1 Tax=Schistosoma mansoni TaxID=6183 RepID=UPI0001A628AC|nr:hypothetical protein Smp_169930 [Schistosoma mansoni]|eukprot:XP_018653011.1 hypothetical protein Smp_169930 [Schistosoma mansoni]
MATAVAVKQNIGNWSKMFPNELGVEIQSLVFIKKLFAVAVSYVLYFRDIFPESAFHDKQLEGIELKILKESSMLPASSKIVYWLKGCFDAIDRHFVDLHPSEFCEYNIIESYCFRLSYGQEKLSLDLKTENKRESSTLCEISDFSEIEARKATLSLLKNIQTAGERLSKLPSELMITMKLQYYDEVTPESYVPPGFKRADNVSFNFEEDNINIRLGNVKTTSRRLLSGSVKSTKSTQEDESIHELSLGSLNASKVNENDDLSLSFQQQTLVSDENESESYEARCPCGVNKDDGVMILCDGCDKWQHAVCFRILQEGDVPTSHVCEICAKLKPELLRTGGTTDETIQNLSVEARKATCLFRRVLALCLNEDSVSPAFIARSLGIEYTVARGLFNRLIKEQVIKGAGPRRGEKLVEKEYLENIVCPRFFSHNSLHDKTSMVSPQMLTAQKPTTIRRTPGKRAHDASKSTSEKEYDEVRLKFCQRS